MPRNPRVDFEGAWIHAMNRGGAKRTICENRQDVRQLLTGFAREVRRGRIEVHALVVLANHFHVLLRSLTGELSDAMKAIENRHARYFNRSRRRDGPLFRGRFRSKVIETPEHWEAVVWYIDRNAEDAGLGSGSSYEFGSSRLQLAGRCPPWLSMEPVRSVLREAYASDAWRDGTASGLAAFVEGRILRDGSIDPLEELLASGPRRLREWMRRKARLADGTDPGVLRLDPAVVLAEISVRRARDSDWRLKLTRRSQSAWEILEVGLLRDLTGIGGPEIAARLGIGEATVRRRARRHRTALSDDRYAAVAASIGERVVARTFSPLTGRIDATRLGLRTLDDDRG